MIANADNYSLLVKGFKWIDSNTIRYVDQEGIESIIALNENFRIKSSCHLPLFDVLKNIQHFHLDKTKNYKRLETLRRLQIKY